MLTVATVLWDANEKSFDWSRRYTEEWVVKLRNQFARNLTRPYRFVCYVDRVRDLPPDIVQRFFTRKHPSYLDCLQPFEMGEPMILVGLDTLILRNIDHLADYCLGSRDVNNHLVAVPDDPFVQRSCNGVVLSPGGHRHIWTKRDRKSNNDMEGISRWPHASIDEIFPGSVKSYKGHVMGQSAIYREGKRDAEPKGIDGVDIVYLHGEPKQTDLLHLDWVRDAWR